MARLTVDQESLNQIRQAMRNAPAYFKPYVDNCLRSEAEAIRDKARSNFDSGGYTDAKYKATRTKFAANTPPHRRTGELQQSIVSYKNQKNEQSQVFTQYSVGISPTATREAAIVANAVEFGHIQGLNGSAVPPHPFLRPAFYESKNQVRSALKATLTEAMQNYST